jgi:hypothetical protein
MHRKVAPLKQKSMHLFVAAALQNDDPTKELVALLATFTGVRVHTLVHIHKEWFYYDENNETGGKSLYLKVPNQAPCRKTPSDDECPECANRAGSGYSPKTGAGGGRRLKMIETWHDHHTGKEQKIDLRGKVEHYFADLTDEFGHAMLNGDGLSQATANKYIKEIADQADIGFYRDPGYVQHDRLGRVPDIFPHDLRATYCVQLMRNDANPFKAINKTGHADVASLKPYIEFAEGEISGDFEDEYI